MNKIILVKNTKIACILAIALVSVFGVALNANAASTGPVTIKVDFTYTSSNIPKTTTLSNNVVVGDNVSFNLVDANGSTVFYPALSPNVQSMQARGEQGKAEFFIHYWSTESDAEGTITISGATFSSIVNEVEDLDDSWWPGSEGYKTGSEDSLTITSDTTATFNLHFNEPGDSFTLNYVPNQINQCQDGIDNDGDGAIDYPSDFSCTSSTDDDETLLKSQCQDGLDNDSDGLIDYSQDIGCSSNQDNDEFNAPINCSTHAQCGTNGLTGSPSCQGNSTYQNYITYTCNNAGTTNSFCSNSTSSQLQSNCSSSQTCSNGICNAIAQCQDGIDNDSDGATDYPGDFSCSSATDNDETNPKAQCQDGIDNDSDGLIDFPSDTGCSSKQDNDEFNAPINCSTNAQCGTNGTTGNDFCQGNSIHKNYTTYTCNNAGTTSSFCSNSTSSQLQSNCSSNQTCSNGSCNNNTTTTITCSSNSQCGTNGFIGGSFCQGNSTYQSYITYTCNNPGTTSSSCSNSTSSQLQATCASNQTCSNNTCVTSQVQSNLSATATIRNLSSGNLNYSSFANASPGDIVQISVLVSVSGSQSLNNVTVKDILPANLTYNNNLTIDGVANGSNITQGVNLGTMSPNIGQAKTITYQAQVGPAANFAFGTTTLNNSITATADGGITSGAKITPVYVTKSSVLGATDIPTGLTNNLWVDSFFLPLVLALLGIWLFNSGLLGNFGIAGLRKKMYQNELSNKIAEIKKREI